MDIASLLSLAAGRPGNAPRGDAGTTDPATMDFAALLQATQGGDSPEALLARLAQQTPARELPATPEALQALARELEALPREGGEGPAALMADASLPLAPPADALPEPEARLPNQQAEVVFSDPQLAEIAARLALVAGPESAPRAAGEAANALATEMATLAARRPEGGQMPAAIAAPGRPAPPGAAAALPTQELEALVPPVDTAPRAAGERLALTPQAPATQAPATQVAAPTAPLVMASEPAGSRLIGGEPGTAVQAPGVVAGQPQATPAPVQGMPSPATASLSAPLATQAWEQQLGQQLVSLGQRGGQVELHLNPAELGPLSVSLKLGDQGAQAQFLSAHAPVRQAVEQALPQLREALAEQGIQLGEASVGEQRGDQAGGFLARGDESGPAHEPSGDLADEAATPLSERQQASLAASLRGGVDLFA